MSVHWNVYFTAVYTFMASISYICYLDHHVGWDVWLDFFFLVKKIHYDVYYSVATQESLKYPVVTNIQSMLNIHRLVTLTCRCLKVTFCSRIPSTARRRATVRVVTAMNASVTPQMAPTAQIVPTHSHLVTVIAIVTAPISRRAPMYRKYEKRREKTETINCAETSIQVSTLSKYYNLWSISTYSCLDK